MKLIVNDANWRSKRVKLCVSPHTFCGQNRIILVHWFAQTAEIKKAAKEGNKDACKLLAKQLVELRKQKNRTFTANSKISSIGFQNKNMGANIALSGAMADTAQTMGEMNKFMRPEKIAGDMRAFQQANMKMEMTDEMSECT